jgi:hypothetical protein
MTRVIRSRRAPASQDLPLYARVLMLRHLAPSGFLCFVFLEGAIALGILLALAELVSWWGVLVLPATVALMVKLNDVVAGMVAGPPATPARRAAPPATRRAPQASRPTAIRPAAGSSAAFGRDDLPTRRRGSGVDLRERGSGPAGRGGRTPPPDAWGNVATETAVARPALLYGTPTSRHWDDRLDVRQQMARQSAARHYE